MNHPVERRQSALALLHERRAADPSVPMATVAAEAGVARGTLRDWVAHEDAIMSVRQATVLYVPRASTAEEDRVIAWIGAQALRPSVLDVFENVRSEAPALFAKKTTYTAKRSYCKRLLDRADKKNLGFVRVEANQYGKIGVPKKTRKSRCGCKRSCGKMCKNRLANRECTASTCRAPSCTNRAMQLADRGGEIPVLRRVHTPGRGDGMTTDTPIKKGTFVREYVGRIVHADDHESLESSGRSGYLMELTKDLYIDALPAGNESRLFNHSCRANCVTRLLYVNDIPRVGVFACRDIRAGDELTIHYGTAYRFAHSCLCPHCAEK